MVVEPCHTPSTLHSPGGRQEQSLFDIVNNNSSRHKVETCESEISVRIESRIESVATSRILIESADSRLQLQC